MALAFDEMDEDFAKSLVYNVIDLIGNVFFFMDIILQMNTTYYDRDGEEIFNKKKIRVHYIFGMFLVDLSSSLPIEVVCPPLPQYTRLLNILKIIRVRRLTTVINKMNVDEEIKSVSLYQFKYISIIITPF